MKATARSGMYANLHPMVIFWLGLITGAVVVGFIFLYNVLNKDDYTNALLKYNSPTYKPLSTSSTLLAPGAEVNTKAIGTPLPW